MSEDVIASTPPPLPPDLPEKRVKKSFWRSPGGVVAIVGFVLAGILMLSLMAIGMAFELGYFPDTAAVAGDDVPARVVARLRDADILEDDERVLYLYCGGLFDYLEDGNLCTDRRVISYWTEDEQLQVDAAPYGEIADVDVRYAKGWVDDALITIERDDGSQFVLYVAGENGGDRKFATALEHAWKRHR
jgi:hypothetical protein